MKRYLLFGGNNYYPLGGWGDFKESFDSIEEAKTVAEERIYSDCEYWDLEWFHIVDTNTWETVMAVNNK